jgi:hypothetical protein
MRSWVRYSVSAYLGLLIAGSIAVPGVGDAPVVGPVASVRDKSNTERMYLVPGYYEPPVHPNLSSGSAES